MKELLSNYISIILLGLAGFGVITLADYLSNKAMVRILNRKRR